MSILIEGLLSTDMRERKESVEEIIKKRTLDIKEELLKIAKSGPTYAKLSALEAYGNIIDIQEVEELYEFLKNKDWHMRVQAIKCIDLLLGENATDILTPYLDDKAYGVRIEVEKILSQYKN